MPKLQRISNSKRGSFLSCEAKYYWEYERKLKPKVTPHALWLGSLIHDGLAEFYRSVQRHQQSDNYNKADAYAQALVLAQAKFVERWNEEMEYLTSLPDNQFNDDAQAQAQSDLELGPAMLNQYYEFALERDDFYVIDVEKELTYRIPGTNVLIVAHVDLIGKTNMGPAVIREHKTADNIYNNYINLQLDTQPTVYALMLAHHYGWQRPRIEYNFLRKIMLKPPTVLKNLSLSKAKMQYTSYELYMKEIQARDLNEDDYEEFLEYLRANPQKTNHIEIVTRGDAEIASDLQNLKATAKLMRKMRLRNPIPNVSWQCRACKYSVLCKTQQAGGHLEEIIESLFKESEYLV